MKSSRTKGSVVSQVGRRMRNLLSLIIALMLLLLVFQGCKHKEIESQWNKDTLFVDGKGED